MKLSPGEWAAKHYLRVWEAVVGVDAAPWFAGGSAVILFIFWGALCLAGCSQWLAQELNIK